MFLIFSWNRRASPISLILMKEKINALQKEIKNYSGSGAEGVEAFRMKYISKKSVINDLFEDFKKLSVEEKKEFGKSLNELKTKA